MTSDTNAQQSTASPSPSSEQADEAPAPAVWVPALKEAAVAFLTAALVLAAVYSIWFRDFHPEFVRFMDRGDIPTLALQGNQFIPIQAGDGNYDGTHAVIKSYLNGAAILEIKAPFTAEDYPFIAFDISGLTTWSNAFVFWQTAAEPGNVHRLQLNRSGDEVTQVAMPYGGSNYSGEITTLAIGFVSDPTDHDNDGEPITLKSAELRGFSGWGVAEQLFEDWTNPPLWQGYSNNIVRGIHATGMVYPNAVANLLVVFGVALAWLWRKRNQLRGRLPQTRLLAVALCLCLYGWGFNDVLRWHWRVAQLLDTQERYAGLPYEERIYNNPIRCGRRDDCFEHLLPYF